MSLTGHRITTPAFVVTSRCSSGSTIWTVTTFPFAYFALVVRTPLEPRRVFRYDTSVDRFPYPLLSTVSSSASGFFDRDIDTTSSPPRTRIPATPAAVRPIGRTCVIGKRFANPPAEARTTRSEERRVGKE